MRNRIWNELTQARHNSEFSSLYIERQRKLLNWFHILVLVFSTGGIMGWSLWNNIPIIACAIVSVISLFKLLQPHVIMSEKQLADLDKVNLFYCKLFNELERLWYRSENNQMSESEVSEMFFNMVDKEIPINKILNELNVKKTKRMVRKAKKYSDDYFAQVYNTKTNNNE